MKKIFYMAAAALMMTACAKEEVVVPSPGNLSGAHDVTIDFNLSVSAGAETRADGRQLWSQQARQEVNEMTVYIFEETKGYIKSVPITGFAADETSKKNHGFETHSQKVAERLPDGNYRFLAVGFDAGKGVYKSLALTPATASANGTSFDSAILELSSGTSNKTSEVFSGVTLNPIAVNSDVTNISVSITVTRVVAGVLGYFTNVPYELPLPDNDAQKMQVKKINVELVSYGKSVQLSTGAKVTQDEFIYKPLMSLTLTAVTNAGKDATSNVWTRPAITVPTSTTPFTVVENSFLLGAFVLPFSHDTSATGAKPTMRVALYGVDTDGKDVLLKTYAVKCTGHGDTQFFDVKANEFYSLGVKKYDDSTNPGTDPNDPNPEPPKPDDPDNDKPIDLSKEDVITVTVNPKWSVIHQLNIVE